MTQMPPPAAPGPVNYGPPSPSQNTGLAVGSLICGIISVVTFCFWFISIPLGIIAIVLAVVARGKIARGEAGGSGLAKAGLITGIIGALLSLLLTIAAWAGLSMLGGWAEREYQRQQQEMQRSTTQPSPDTDTETDTDTTTDTDPGTKSTNPQ